MSNFMQITAIKAALSSARILTYEVSTGQLGDEDASALELYAWNASVSGALLLPLHICEVVIRNAVADSLESIYGDMWPWSSSFERSLPDPSKGYSSRKDLIKARSNVASTGKVIPELKFVFWQNMFTNRHNNRIWKTHLKRIFPNANSLHTVSEIRADIYKDLEVIRKLRNRIAHHEPVFNRDLPNELQKTLALIALRWSVTERWINQHQQVTTIIANKPNII